MSGRRKRRRKSPEKHGMTAVRRAALLRPRDIAYLLAAVEADHKPYPRKLTVLEALQETWRVVNVERLSPVVVIEVNTTAVEFERQAQEDAARRQSEGGFAP